MIALAETQRALQAHIVDGDGGIHALIHGSQSASPEFRLRAYSDAYRLRLIEALAANYPAMAAHLGESAFARAAQQYLAVYPSQHYSVRWFGHRLPEFLAAFEEYRERRDLYELAAWEWKIATAFDASDAVPLELDALASVAPERWPELTFGVHPSVQRIDLTTDAAALAKAVLNDAEVPTPSTTAETKTAWLIWRQELVVRYRALDPAEQAGFDVVATGADFGALCEVLSDYTDIDAVPLHAATLLKTWIGEQLLIAP